MAKRTDRGRDDGHRGAGALIGPGGKKGEEQTLKLPTSDRIKAAGMDQVYLRQVLTLQYLLLD